MNTKKRTAEDRWTELTDRERFGFLFITNEDLDSAAIAISLAERCVLRLGVYNLPLPYPHVSEEKSGEYSAFIDAAVIRYGRPFTKNRVNEKSQNISLPDRYLKDLNADERALHERLIEMRDRSIAHSDHDFVRFTVFTMGIKDPEENQWTRSVLPSVNVQHVVEISQLQYFAALVEKIVGAIEPDLSALSSAHLEKVEFPLPWPEATPRSSTTE